VVPLEPWEKVYIKLLGTQKSYTSIDEVHGLIGCVNCHGGKEPAIFETAHDTSFSFLRDPSNQPEEFCNPCHESIVENNKNSMHSKLWGERTAIAQRAGYSDFDECPSELTEGFDGECMNCHTTCGQCHVSRPNNVDGGFVNNHKFVLPDQANNCFACHGSRIRVDYLGDLIGNKPDVHYSMGKKCWDCHTEDFHADASEYTSRYHFLKDQPEVQCDFCHPDVAETNDYHTQHWPSEGEGLSCFVCHSQPYYNCNSCHVEGEWKEGYGETGQPDVMAGGGDYLEFPDFKIGYNYDQTLHKGKWIVVRHIPISKDSYEPWGHAELTNYDDRPTWEYTSPHNINRWTAQTDTTGGNSCSDNCHVHEVRYDEEGNYSNFNYTLIPGIFLLPDSISSDEAIANDSVAVTSSKVSCSPCHQ